MRKLDLEGLAKILSPGVEETVKQAVHDVAQHRHLSHWHPISTVPYNRDVELRVDDKGKLFVLPFPCRQLNMGSWINSDLGTPIKIKPVEWRVWQHGESPLASAHSRGGARNA